MLRKKDLNLIVSNNIKGSQVMKVRVRTQMLLVLRQGPQSCPINHTLRKIIKIQLRFSKIKNLVDQGPILEVKNGKSKRLKLNRGIHLHNKLNYKTNKSFNKLKGNLNRYHLDLKKNPSERRQKNLLKMFQNLLLKLGMTKEINRVLT